MARYLPIIMVVLLAIYCMVEVAQAPTYAVRRMPRWLWATAIVFVPVGGSLAWLIFGRPTSDTRRTGRPASRPKAPDDDNDFLRGL